MVKALIKMTSVILSLSTILSLAVIPQASAAENTAPSAPNGLLTNELEYPLNVEDATFGWLVNDNEDNVLYALNTTSVKDKSADITVEVPNSNADVKFMLWDSLNGTKPLYETLTVKAGAYEDGTEEKQKVIALTDTRRFL